MKLEIQGLEKSLKGQVILKNINLEISDGKALGIIGPSGSGKSTLLKILAGILVPDTGSIKINEQEMHFTEKALRRYRLQMGIVFQSWNLFPHLTALENISLPLHLVHKNSPKEAEEKALQLLRRFNLEDQSLKKPFELSGGQIQRVAIIRAIANRPKIVFLDEPTSALDPLMTIEVLDLISELKKEGADLVFVTHHIPFASKMCDWIIFIQGGRVIESNQAKLFFKNPETPEVKNYLSQLLKYEPFFE